MANNSGRTIVVLRSLEMASAGSRRTFHVPVENLDVPARWLVGKVTFRPSGWLGDQARRRVPLAPPTWAGQFADTVAKEIEELGCATASVAANSPEEAHERAREAVAVLRLYQRARYLYVDLEAQTFGLRGDLDSWVMPYYVAPTRLPFIGGWSRGGVFAEWAFSAVDRAAFAGDPVFAYLHEALARPEAARTDFENRAIRALSVRHLAVASRPDALRVPFVAVTLEALLGDSKSRDKAHRIAQRVAYLTCGGGCGRSVDACFYLRARDRDAVDEQISLARRQGSHGLCSAYWKIRDLFDARVSALHEAQITFEKREAANLQYWTDRTILDVLRWIAESGALGLPDLTVALETAVAANGGPVTASPEFKKAKSSASARPPTATG